MNWLKSLTYISIADYKQLGIDKVLRNALLVHRVFGGAISISTDLVIGSIGNWWNGCYGSISSRTSEQSKLIWDRLTEQLTYNFIQMAFIRNRAHCINMKF